MGEVIGPTAAVDDIIDDLKGSLERAKVRGGEWKSLAENYLGPVVAVIVATEAQAAPVEAALEPLEYELLVINDDADDTIKSSSDMIWNKLGRPGNDVYLEVIFPGGTAVYTDAKPELQPARMHLLAELLDKGVHPTLDQAVASSCAQEIRAKADVFQAKVNAIAPLKNKLELLNSVRTALARAGRQRLVSLKRAYLAAGFSEADIHQVIPDRPSARSKKKKGGEGG